MMRFLLFLLILSGVSAQEPYWIKGQAGETALEGTVELNKWVHSARIYIAAESEFTLYINGSKVLSGSGKPQFKILKVTEDIQKDFKNKFVIETAGSKAVIMDLILEYYDGRPFHRSTDEKWKTKSGKPVEILCPLGEKPKEYLTRDVLNEISGYQAPKATDPATMKIRDGFKVELLYTVPEVQGSWVSLTTDNKGRLLAADQYGAIYRISQSGGRVAGVEKIELDIGHAQGLLYAFDSLYVAVSRAEHGGRGVYRIKDTDGDDRYDKKELIKKFPEVGSEHGLHSLVLGPDKKLIYLITGNQTPYEKMDHSRAPRHWQEDILLPRTYAKGMFKGLKPPGGWIARVDPEGKNWERIAVGFRNPFDMAFNKDGDLFTYDSDMELDHGAPWYRPTRVCMVASGGEFGWRHASGKWPVRWEDSLPGIEDIGGGSPTGLVFGYGAELPEVFENAMFMCDWSYGKLYAVHMTPSGGAYKCRKEEIISGQPLPLTDIVVNRHDKAMYFTIGGRRVQSGLYRLTWKGGKKPVPLTSQNDLRSLRRDLESFHKPADGAVEKAWPYLNHRDRFIRFAARTALEHQPVSKWATKVESETDINTKIFAQMALVRSGGVDFNKTVKTFSPVKLSLLNSVSRGALLRTFLIAGARSPELSASLRDSLIRQLSADFPCGDPGHDADVLELLVHLDDPSAASKGIALLEKASSQEEEISYAKSLRLLKSGWTAESRQKFFQWFGRAQSYPGGASLPLFITRMSTEALKNAPESEKAALRKALAEARAKPETVSGPLRAYVKNWQMSDFKDVSKLLAALKKKRNLANGEQIYSQSMCISCHKFGRSGGIYGPDLTNVAGKFSGYDLLKQIIEPNLEISDQYGSMIFEKSDGSTVTGRIVNLGGSTIRVNTNIANPNEFVILDRRFVKSMKQNPVSMMPPGLLNTLTEEDIYDFLAYLLKRE